MDPRTWNLSPAEVRAFWISLAANAVLFLAVAILLGRKAA
jgi:hypothetical protein